MGRKRNVIAVMSPKGGVGKTVTTANLAAALALVYNKKVLAVDTNISTASLGFHFDIFFPEHTIHDLSHKTKKYEAIHIYHQNLHIIPATIKIRKQEKNIRKIRENLSSLVKDYDRFLDEVANEYDLVLLDCSPGFDLEAIAAMHVAGGLIVVTNPDYPSISTAAKLIEYARKSKMPVGGIILNKIRNKKYELKKEDIENALGVKIVGEIPYDKKVPESIHAKRPVVLFKTNSKSGKAFRKIAAEIIGAEYEGTGIEKYWKKLKGKKIIK